MTRYLTVEEVLRIHERMIEDFGGTHGVRDLALLESAVARPQTSAFGQDAYPTLAEKGAALLHSLAKNHPFLDGNKRAAFGAMHMMLLLNGFDLSGSTDDDEVEFTLQVATSRLKLGDAAGWINDHMRKVRRIGKKTLKRLV